MSEKGLRRRIPANRRAIITSNSRAPRSSPSPATSPAGRRRSRPEFLKPSKDVKVLKRSKSEPSLWKAGVGETETPATLVQEEGVLYRPSTCTDVFVSPETLNPLSPLKCSEVYKKDAKVVVNVSVEGSPGPIKTLVKLGCNVEDTINLVINKYNEEGRTPRMDKRSASNCELHRSYFSLESLSRSELIGDIGSRSFYLRKSRAETTPDLTATTDDQLPASAIPFLPTFIDDKIKKIILRMPKFEKFFGCIPCIG